MPPSVSGPAGFLPILGVLLLTLLLGVAGIGWGLPHTMDWAIDSVAPYRVLQGAYDRFSGGWWDKYPPFHLILLALLYAPYLAYLKLTGELADPARVFPFGLEDPTTSLGATILIARLVSLLMAVGIVLVVYLTVRRLFDRLAGVFAALVVAVMYPFVYYAHAANLDVPYLFWSLLAVYAYLEVLRRGSLRSYLCFALFATLAICTKDQAYGLFVLAPLAVVWARFRERPAAEPFGRRLLAAIVDRRHALALGLALALFAVLQNLPFNFTGFVQHAEFITGPGSENYHEFPASLEGRVLLLLRTLSYVADGLTWPLFVACLAGCALCAVRFPERTLPILLLAASYWLTFQNALRMVLPRFVLPIAILMAFYGGKLLADLWRAPARQPLARVVTALALAYASAFAIQLDVLFVRDPRYEAERWLARHVPDGAIIETFAPPALLNYYPRFPERFRVRTSRLEAGTAWAARLPSPERVQIPNLYGGREAADYIVLSEFWYDRFLDPARMAPADAEAGRRVLRNLMAGRLGYRLVRDFKTPTLLPLRDLRVNPRILVFERTPTAGPEPLPAAPEPPPDRARDEDFPPAPRTTARRGGHARLRIPKRSD